MVLRAAGEKHFTAVYEDGQFAGIEDAGTLTIFRRQQGVDETLSNWNETSLQSAPEGYFADATAEVNGEQCTIRIEASIEEAASYKLIAGTWTITKPKNDERDD